MKQLFRFCAGVVLTMGLALPAMAGHIPCGITDPPPEAREGLIECGKLVVETVYTALTGVWMVF